MFENSEMSYPHPANEHSLNIGRQELPGPGHFEPFVQASVVRRRSSGVVR